MEPTLQYCTDRLLLGCYFVLLQLFSRKCPSSQGAGGKKVKTHRGKNLLVVWYNITIPHEHSRTVRGHLKTLVGVGQRTNGILHEYPSLILFKVAIRCHISTSTCRVPIEALAVQPQDARAWVVLNLKVAARFTSRHMDRTPTIGNPAEAHCRIGGQFEHTHLLFVGGRPLAQLPNRF